GGGARGGQAGGRGPAGAVADQIVRAAGTVVLAWVESVQDLRAEVDDETVTSEMVEANAVRCPDAEMAARMFERIDAVRKQGDSVGGVLRAIARGVPQGLGAPVFDKLEADLAKAMLSLPACQGFEIGRAHV